MENRKTYPVARFIEGSTEPVVFHLTKQQMQDESRRTHKNGRELFKALLAIQDEELQKASQNWKEINEKHLAELENELPF